MHNSNTPSLDLPLLSLTLSWITILVCTTQKLKRFTTHFSHVWYILNKIHIYLCFAPVVQLLGLGKKKRYLNRLIIGYKKEQSNCKSKTKKDLKSIKEHQIPKAQIKSYRAYPKAAQSKERGKKEQKNTIKQNIMLLSLLIQPLEEWICYLLIANPGVALRILRAFSFTSFGNCGSLRNCGQRRQAKH